MKLSVTIDFEYLYAVKYNWKDKDDTCVDEDIKYTYLISNFALKTFGPTIFSFEDETDGSRNQNK